MEQDKNHTNNNHRTQKAMETYLSSDKKGLDANAFEQMMEHDSFVEDAVEGLQELPPGTDTNELVAKLNAELMVNLHKKKERRKRRPTLDIRWTLAAIFFIILMCLVIYNYYKAKGH